MKYIEALQLWQTLYKEPRKFEAWVQDHNNDTSILIFYGTVEDALKKCSEIFETMDWEVKKNES